MSGFKPEVEAALPGPRPASCPKCRRAFGLITHAQAKYVGCAHCGMLLAVEDGNFVQILSLAKNKAEPLVPIGSKGRINGVLYSVVGFLVYKERNAQYFWREYVLFNPVHGYAQLAEYDGHWNFYRFIADVANGGKVNKDAFQYQGDTYKLYHKYRTTVFYAEGEFYWDLREDNNQYVEYISPPYMLTHSIGSSEQSWMLGEYLEPEQVQETFNLTGPMPDRIGPGAIEPFSKAFSVKTVATLAGIAAAILLLVQVIFHVVLGEKVLFKETFVVTEEAGKGTLAPVRGPVLTLNGSALGSSNLLLEMYAPVRNTWFASGVSLLNTQTGMEYFVELGVEHYSGYESGEHWTEGSERTEELLSAIPDGTYQVLFEPSREAVNYGAVPSTFSITIQHETPIWSNFWISLLLIALVPIIQGIRTHSFEKNRWMNSDYTPYTSE